MVRMQDSPNPFASPPERPQADGPVHPPVTPGTGGTGMFAVVPVLCVLMIVLGSLELLYAISIGGVLRVGMVAETGGGSVSDVVGQVVMVVIFCGVGFVGLLRIIAAVGGLKYRGWGLMMAACCVGLATVLTCYCAPFTLVVGILGIIVLSDRHVRHAFDLAKTGASPADVKRAITGR
ncbi:MAG: hypothetical protein Aurels2KO_08400 [Aureliella sp.]